MKRFGWPLIIVVIFLLCNFVTHAKVNINTATAAELEKLSKIGPGLAQTIIDYRNANGPFGTIEDIQSVPKIGEKTFEAIKNEITVGEKGSSSKLSTQPASPPEPPKSPMQPITKESDLAPVIKDTATPAPSIEEIMNQFQHEPSISAVQKAAVRFAEIDPAQHEKWRRDVRNKFLIPEYVQMTVGHDTDDDHGYARGKTISISGGEVTIGPDDEAWDHDTDDDWDYELKMRWKLQDYLFNRDMLRVSAETENRVEFRQEILSDITKLYFDRRRLQIDIFLNPPSDIQTKMKQMLRLEELTATIDGLTGGYLTAEMSKRRGMDAGNSEAVEK